MESGGQRIKDELLFAIEFKYVIRNTKGFVEQVHKDNRKLEWARDWGVKQPINLVFCNIAEKTHVNEIQELIRTASKRIVAVFVQSYYDKDNRKHTKPPIANIDIRKLPYCSSGMLGECGKDRI